MPRWLDGRISTGKSTLVNALLKDDVLESGIVQGTTTFPIRIRYAARLAAKLHLRDGTRLPLIAHSRDEVLQQLRSCARGEDVETRLSHASLYLNADLLAGGVEIIDAPGIDSISKSHLRITLEAMERFCDAFVILVPSTMPATMNLLSFVRENLNERFDRCIFLVTKTDLLRSKRDTVAVIENAKARIMSELCLSAEPVVFGCAAEIALCRTLGIDPNEDRSKPLTAANIEAYCTEFDDVREQIVAFGKRQQELVIRDGIATQLERMRFAMVSFLKDPLESLGFSDSLDDWIPATQMSNRVRKGLNENRNWTEELTSSALVEFELEAKRELNSAKSKLEFQLAQKSGCSEISLWAKSQPMSQLSNVCTTLESVVRGQFRKTANAINANISDLVSDIKSTFPQFRIPTKLELSSDLTISLTSVAEGTCNSLNSVRSDAPINGAEVGGGVTLGIVGAFFGGPFGAVIGAQVGRAIGKAFDDGSEALRIEVRPIIASAFADAQRRLIAEAKSEFKNAIDRELSIVARSFEAATAEYENARKKIENERPNIDSLYAQCNQSFCRVDELQGAIT